MALPESGTELVAKNADKFISKMDQARDAQGKFTKGIQDSAKEADKSNKKFDKLGDLMGGALKIGAIAAATALGGVALAIGSTIDDARESIAAGKELEAVLKSTGGAAGLTQKQLEDMASGLQDVSLFSDEAAMHAESVLLTFTNIGKDAFPDALQAAADLSQMLGQDLQSSAVQLGKALNDPINGVTALQRVGVSFTKSQKDQIKVMVEAGDTAGAQALILKELGKEFGGQAQAARDAAGPQADWNVLLGEFQESIGKEVLPLLDGLMANVLIPLAKNVLPGVVQGFQDFLTSVENFVNSPVVQSAGGVIAALFTTGVDSPEFQSAMSDLGQKLADALDAALANSPELAQAFGYVLSAALDAGLDSPEFAEAVANLPDALDKITVEIQNWVIASKPTWAAEMRKMDSAFLDWVTDPGGPVAQIGPELDKFTVAVQTWAAEQGPKLDASAMTWIPSFIKWINEPDGATAQVGPELDKFTIAIQTWATTQRPILADEMRQWDRSFLDWITDPGGPVQMAPIELDNMARAIQTWIGEQVPKVNAWTYDLGKGIVDGIRSGIEDAWNDLSSWFIDQINGLINWGKQTLGIGSPSTVAAEMIGLPLAEGIAEGIMAGSGMVRSALGGVLGGAVTPAASASQLAGRSMTINNSPSTTFSLNMTTAASSQGVRSDFRLMQVLAGA